MENERDLPLLSTPRAASALIFDNFPAPLQKVAKASDIYIGWNSNVLILVYFFNNRRKHKDPPTSFRAILSIMYSLDARKWGHVGNSPLAI